jgi:hypothetical protein
MMGNRKLIMKQNVLAFKSFFQVVQVGLLFTALVCTAAHSVELIGQPVVGDDIQQPQATVAAELTMKSELSTESEADAQGNEVEPTAAITKTHDDNIEWIKEKNRHEEAMLHRGADKTADHDSSGEPWAAEVLLPIIVIMVIFGGGITLIIMLLKLHYRDKERRAQNINNNIDKLLAAGRDIPIELLRGDEPVSPAEPYHHDGVLRVRDDVNLHKGIKNICVGLGLLIFLSLLCGFKIGAVGFIVIGVGISRLLIWKLSGTTVSNIKAQD